MPKAHLVMPTRKELKKWAPNASDSYLDAIDKLGDKFAEYGVLDDPLTLCHFLGQIGAETDGLRITRESMYYTSVRRIRQVWPSRARRYSDLWIARNLVRKPERLAAWAYGGRMGNARWPSQDGYVYRGAGMMQTTGKYAFKKYCDKLGIPLTAQVGDDYVATTMFALYEWKESGCGRYAMENDLLAVSKIINTGSATSGIRPNGMSHRQRWFKRAWNAFGDRERIYVPEASTITAKQLKEMGSETVSSAEIIKGGALAGGVVSGAAGAAQESGLIPLPAPDVPTATVIEQLKDVSEKVDVMTMVMSSTKSFATLALSNLWVTGIALSIAGVLFARHVINRRARDARVGANMAYLGQLPAVDDSVIKPGPRTLIPR